jgi:hypothetical protein
MPGIMLLQTARDKTLFRWIYVHANFIQLFKIDWIMRLMFSKQDDKIYSDFRRP